MTVKAQVINSSGTVIHQFDEDTDALIAAAINTYIASGGTGLQPGDTLEFTADINIGATPLLPQTSGQEDSRITIKSNGGVLSQWVDIIESGGDYEITFALPSAWSDGNYADGSVVTHSGSTWSASTAVTTGQEPGVHASWYDVGGTTYVGTLPAGLTGKAVANLWLDGDQTYSRRWVGVASPSYTTGFERVNEWSVGPDRNAPTTIYIRSETSPNSAYSEIRVCPDTGAIKLTADGTSTPSFFTIEDLLYSYVSSPFIVESKATATEDLLGFVARRVNGSNSGAGGRLSGASTTDGGPNYSVRSYLIEDCHTQYTGNYGFAYHTVGGGYTRGCSVKDYCLNTSVGAYYVGGAGGGEAAGVAWSPPDEKVFENCWFDQSEGLYVETGGVGNFWNSDHGSGLYNDTRSTETLWIACKGKDGTYARAMHSNSGGGRVRYAGCTGISFNQLLGVSDSTGGESGTTEAYNCSGVNIADAISYSSTTKGTHILRNIAFYGQNSDVAISHNGTTSTVDRDKVMAENVTAVEDGSGTYSGNITTAETGLFDSLTDDKLASSSPALYAGTTSLESVPALDLTDTSDDAWVTTGLTSSTALTIAMTINHTANSNELFNIGQDNNNRLRARVNASDQFLIVKNDGGTAYNSGLLAITADQDNRIVLRFDDVNGHAGWLNGVKTTVQADVNIVDVLTGPGPAGVLNLLGLSSGSHGLDGSVHDVIIHQGALTDAHCALL